MIFFKKISLHQIAKLIYLLTYVNASICSHWIFPIAINKQTITSLVLVGQLRARYARSRISLIIAYTTLNHLILASHGCPLVLIPHTYFLHQISSDLSHITEWESLANVLVHILILFYFLRVVTLHFTITVTAMCLKNAVILS